MGIPSPARILVELQKVVPTCHRRLLQSPLGPLVSTTPFGRFLILHTTGRHSGQVRTTPLSYTKDGDTYVVIASDGGSPRHPDRYLNLEGPKSRLSARAESIVSAITAATTAAARSERTITRRRSNRSPIQPAAGARTTEAKTAKNSATETQSADPVSL